MINSCQKNITFNYERSKTGFTLIELLVVVLIMGILTSIAVPQYQLVVEKSRVAEALINLRAIRNAQEEYYLANGVYTIDKESLDVAWKGLPGNWNYSVNDNGAVVANRVGVPFDKGYFLAFRLAHGSSFERPSAVCGWRGGEKQEDWGLRICRALRATQPDPTAPNRFILP